MLNQVGLLDVKKNQFSRTTELFDQVGEK